MIGKVLQILGTICLLLIGMNSLQAQTRKVIYAERKSPVGKVTYPSTAVITGQSVDGYVRVKGAGKFIFPLSDNGIYRPMSTTVDGAYGAYFAANPSVAITSDPKGGNYPPLPLGAPFPITSKDASITAVSNVEYWDVVGAVATKITISWNTESNIATLLKNNSISRLFIVGWTGTKWVKLASTVDATSILGSASTVTSGSITTSAAIIPNTYNVYTFGTDVPQNTREMFAGADSSNVPLDGQEIAKQDNSSFSEVETAIYPNPVTDRIFIRNDGKIRQVSIFDLTGRRVIFVNGNRAQGIDVNSLPAGAYLVSVEDDKGKTTSRKIIINK
ncbi:T9SS type A sorting domain-containing protein [Dyadobacter jiangsuensis]|uniref:Putative secreted protein (Por secretion system target) n=1 Tax=Dyadobacter jiangsuensis TaxID=1591085 RepID=A0A2P8FSS9_9BACT|nr:T9SS type A sorting domain-containing protein [Dyadobacter jiangsuensis]PSL24784.1 putative secreted protein (Por secretion system target) [Dyadobacter jiangsuensis]